MIVKKEDLKGCISDFPIEIVQKMIERQVEQGNPPDISVFTKDRFAGSSDGGFWWENTKEGLPFWTNVIERKKFNLFFERYPKNNSKNNTPLLVRKLKCKLNFNL